MEDIKFYAVNIYKIFRIRKLRYEWRWKVVATNGQIIGSATESYVNKQDCIYNIHSLGLSLTTFIEK